MKTKVILLFLLSILCIKASAQEANNVLPLDSIVQLINRSLMEAQADLEGTTLTAATITLQVVQAKEGGGGFKLFAKASGKWSKEYSSSITYSYKEIPEPTEKSLVKFENNLTKSISSAALEFKNSTMAISGLKKDSFTIEIAFAVKKAGGGGIEFEIFGIGLDISGEGSNKASHKIKLVFS